MDYADGGESASMKTRGADVKKALCSVRMIKLKGNVAVLSGGRSYMQNKENGQKTRIKRDESQRVVCLWLQAKEEEAQRRRRKF